MKNFKFREKFVAASFLISIILFILLRHYLPSNKGYAFFAFLLIPLAPFIVGLKKIRITYPLLIIIIYLILGFTLSWWHPGWVLFITIPIFYIFFPKNEKEKTNKKFESREDDIYID